jgi:hypothetical protein
VFVRKIKLEGLRSLRLKRTAAPAACGPGDSERGGGSARARGVCGGVWGWGGGGGVGVCGGGWGGGGGGGGEGPVPRAPRVISFFCFFF